MSELRDALEREGERFDLSPGALERLHHRRLRRQRARRIGAAALSLALTTVGVMVTVRAFQAVRPAQGPASQPRIAETSSLGVRPAALAVSEDAVWVVTSADDILRRLDPVSGELVDEIQLPDGLGPPSGVAVWRGAVWVQTGFVGGAQEIHPAVVRVDPTTGVSATMFLDRGEHTGIALGAGALWSANTETGVVSRRTLSEGRVTATVRGPTPPLALVFGEGAVWSLGQGRGDVVPPTPGVLARIDPGAMSVTSSTEVGINPKDVAVGGGAVWVVHARSRTVLQVDAATASAMGEVRVPGALPSHISGGRSGIWVLDTSEGVLSRIDPSKGRVTGSIRVGAGAVALANARDGVWVARAGGTVLRVEV